MKLKPNLRLRQIGRWFMVVDMATESVDMSNVFTLNEVAAGIWKQIGKEEVEVERLADWLCEEYEVDRETARKDVERLVLEWQKYGLLV